MAVLLSGVSSTAHYWPVDEIPESDYVRCDDEVVRVLTRHPTRQRIRVERGAEGTAAASHAADAEVSAAYVVGDSGGEQTIRLLGPFTVTAAEVNAGTLVVPGRKLILAPVEANVLVLSAWAFFTTGWSATSGTAVVTLGIDLESDEFDMVDVKRYVSQDGSPLSAGSPEAESILGTTNTVSSQIVRRTVAGNLYVYAERADTGTAEVYALIAEPV